MTGRVPAPFGRRRCEIVGNRETGGYRIVSALDREGTEPLPGQFYMLTGEDWGGPDGRPFLPRAFSGRDGGDPRSRASASTFCSRSSGRDPSGSRRSRPAGACT